MSRRQFSGRHKEAGFDDKEGLRKRLENQRCITPDGHWNWFGFTNTQGYGRVKIDNKMYMVTRVAMFVYKGFDINSEDQVLHNLDCNSKRCFNPEHLHLGDNAQNRYEYGLLNRQRSTFKFCGHPRSPENIVIYAGYENCLTCRRTKSAEYMREKRKKDANSSTGTGQSNS